ncbi:uncharacterized protein LOC110713633 isoform X2 [Chenopodium quinoa]|uniref:uncharacterized protein LOC110713633 isoform X2 n=1 Tax=Chenopodium quinoa TaxID=63459 RepID=UPI000B79A38B|nr:uncharacterized protein LOC110713633 isoform X2 [Chenopodium quinoa]
MRSSQQDADGTNASFKRNRPTTTKRGATRMKKVVRARNRKMVFPVQWNSKGQPIGNNSVIMSSYLGATTRSTIPINYEDWDRVPYALKNAIWEDVSKTSEDNRQRAKKNKYPQKRSHRGCARLEQDMLAELASTDNPMTSIPRASMWKAIRSDKRTGKVYEKAQEVAEKIDMLENLAANGEFPDSGREDVLFKALGNKAEHGGRVRGVGSGVNITDYFGSLKNPKESQDEVKDLKSMVMAMSNELRELRSLVNSGTQSKKTTICDTIIAEENEEELTPSCNSPIEFPEGLTACELALSEPSYRIVATGKVHNIPNVARVVHGVPLLSNQVRVSIEYIYEKQALLPVPLKDEAYTLNEALGTHVAWPCHLVIIAGKIPTQPTSKAKQTNCTKGSKNDNQVTAFPSLQTTSNALKTRSFPGQTNAKIPITPKVKEKEVDQSWQAKKPEEQTTSKTKLSTVDMEVVINVDALPHELRLTYMYAKRMKKDEQIMIPMEEAIVNQSQQIYMGKEEIFQLIAQEEIGACHMSAYIMLMYRNCQATGKSKFGFLCPSSISLVVQSRHEEKIQENRVERARYIVNALQGTTRKEKVYLAPYNAGRHWILCVIDPEADVVYYLDPLRKENCPIGDDLRSVVETALLIYQNQVVGSKKVKKSTTWSKIQYFSDCLWPNYSTEQIDEVKTELARHILYFAS